MGECKNLCLERLSEVVFFFFFKLLKKLGNFDSCFGLPGENYKYNMNFKENDSFNFSHGRNKTSKFFT